MTARGTNQGREPTEQRNLAGESPAGESPAGDNAAAEEDAAGEKDAAEEQAAGPHPDGPTEEDRRRFEELRREVFGPRCC